MYFGSAPCCQHAILLGASTIQSKQAVASLSIMITWSCRISALLIFKSMAHHLLHPPPWLSVRFYCFLLHCLNPCNEKNLRSSWYSASQKCIILRQSICGLPWSFSRRSVHVTFHLSNVCRWSTARFMRWIRRFRTLLPLCNGSIGMKSPCLSFRGGGESFGKRFVYP